MKQTITTHKEKNSRCHTWMSRCVACHCRSEVMKRCGWNFSSIRAAEVPQLWEEKTGSDSSLQHGERRASVSGVSSLLCSLGSWKQKEEAGRPDAGLLWTCGVHAQWMLHPELPAPFWHRRGCWWVQEQSDRNSFSMLGCSAPFGVWKGHAASTSLHNV